MFKIACMFLIALALVACGGDDDSDDSSPESSGAAPTSTVASTAPTQPPSSSSGITPASMPSASTPAEAISTEATSSEPTPTGATSEDPGDDAGAPTHASSDFPDVRVPLEVGSSGEVGSMDPDPFATTGSRDENSTVKVTITDVLDPAEVDGTTFSPEAGNRWFAIYVTMEATGSGIANTGEWTLATTDGNQYTNIIVLGNVPYISYDSIEPGETAEGIIVFEIPEDAEVAWIFLSPTIYVGNNLVFVN